MPRRRLPYRDGTWFAVPLRTSGYGLGLVARHDGRGGVIGYFFNAHHDKVPLLASVSGTRPADAMLVLRFGDLGLIDNEWPILGELDGWRPEEWPMPVFGRRDMSGRAYRVIYSADNLGGPVREEQITDDECNKLPSDGLDGAGSVELVLTELLRP